MKYKGQKEGEGLLVACPNTMDSPNLAFSVITCLHVIV